MLSKNVNVGNLNHLLFFVVTRCRLYMAVIEGTHEDSLKSLYLLGIPGVYNNFPGATSPDLYFLFAPLPRC